MKKFLRHITMYILLMSIMPLEEVVHVITGENYSILSFMDPGHEGEECNDDPEKEIKIKFHGRQYFMPKSEFIGGQSIFIIQLIRSLTHRSTETPPPDYL